MLPKPFVMLRRLGGAVVPVLLAAVVACGGSSSPGPSPSCSYTLSSQGQSFSSDGGTGSVRITTAAQCAWSVAGATDWVSLLSSASGTGSGVVGFGVLQNQAEAAREMTLTVAALPFRVSQEGRAACTFSIAPEQKAFDDEGGEGQVEVTTAAGCAWAANSKASWMTIATGAKGEGPGAVRYTVAPNNATVARSGTLTVAGRTFTVDQDGETVPPADCRYTVAPTDFAPCMAGGRLTADVTTQSTCTWTATSDASWLSIAGGASGSGSGVIAFAFGDNYDAPREGIVRVRWPAPTLGQNIRVAQAGCLYAVSRSDIPFAAAGGTGTFDVLQESDPNTCGGPTQDRCVWTARSDVSWIVVTTSMPHAGDDPVSFTVSANTGTTSRTGRITVRDKVVVITQAAP